MATLTSKLILSLVDRVSAPARGISKQIDNLTRRQRENSRAMRETAGKLGAVSLAAAGVVGAFAAPINAAVQFEEAMADVKKVVNFDTPDGFRKLGKDIIDMSTRLPMTAQGISEIVAAAGQSGIAGDELLKFAELASKVGIAFDISAGETGEALAKIKTQLGLSVGETGELADAINHLSNTSASAAPDLVEFMKRVASVGKISGLSAEETAAIGSAMIAAGAEADVAATSLRNMTKALSKGTTATKAQRDAYKRLGLNAGQVAKDMQEDATGTIRKVMNAIRELPKHVQQSTVSQLFGDEARALLPLIENTELLNNALDSVANRANYLGSAQKEYEARAATTANSMQLFRNKVSALGIAIGSALMPALNRIMDVLGPFIQRLAALAEKYPQVTQAVAGASLGLIALTGAALAAKFAMLGLRAVGLSSVLVGMKALRGVLFTLLNPLGLVRGAFIAMRTALLFSPIGIAVGALAAAGYWVYNNWNNVTKAFEGFKEGFSAAIGPASEALSPLIDGVKRLWDNMSGMLGPVEGAGEAFRQFGESAGQAIGAIVKAVLSGDFSQIGNAIMDKLQAGLNAAMDAGAGFLNFAGKLYDQIATQITSIDFSNAGVALAKAIKAGLSLAIDGIGTFLSGPGANIGSIIKDAIVSAVSGISGLFVGLFDGEKSNVEAAALNALSGLGNLVQSILRSAFSFYAGFFTEMFGDVAQKILTAIGVVDFFNAFENPIPKILEWFKGLPGRIIEAIGNIDLSGILKWPSLPTWLGGSGATTNSATSGKTVSSFSTGGLVNGPGTGTSDSILSRLSNGEFVVRAAAVRKFGLSNLQAINSMQTPSPRGIGSVPMPRTLPAANSNSPRSANNQPSSISFGDIHIHGGPGASAAEIRSEFSREAGAMMRSRYSDGAA